MYIFLSESLYLGSRKGVLLHYYLHVEVTYGDTHVRTDLSWNYRNRGKSTMAAHTSAAIAYQHLLLFIKYVILYKYKIQFCYKTII